jgi:hypothetical protein
MPSQLDQPGAQVARLAANVFEQFMSFLSRPCEARFQVIAPLHFGFDSSVSVYCRREWMSRNSMGSLEAEG